MNKKLMAVAVAGALAAPAMAFAQASTVQIYGLLNAEYGFFSQPDTGAGVNRPNADGFNSGASRIGFKGEEKLGSGMSAWFQCESDIRFLSGSTRTSGSWCDRNSALGLKGGFGNFFVGTWDTPLKQAVAKTRILNETGWLGAQYLLLTANFDASRRLAQSINYVTPTMGGFTARAQITSTNAQFDKTAAGLKGRIVGFGADYSNGPLVVAAGWEKADDNRAEALVGTGGAAGAKDTSWGLGATYTFGPVKAGVTYTDQKAEFAGVEVKKKAWNLAADWMVTAAGTVRVGWTQADDFKGTVTAPNSGAKQWQLGYNHALSKRTTAGIAYVKLDNDSAGDYNLTGRTLDASGRNASAVVFSLTHTF